MSECNIVFSHLFSDNSMYEDTSYLTDATLLTEDGWSFKVHRIILVKKSIFLRMLFSSFKDDSQEFLVPRIKGNILNLLLIYIYTNAIPIKNENVSELLMAANYLQVNKLVFYIMNNISVQNCINIYMTSLKINDENLIKLSYRFIQTNFETVVFFNTVEFVKISFDSLKQLLNDNNLRVSDEDLVLSSIVKWVLKEPIHRLCKIYDLLKCVKVSEIDVSLASKIIRRDVVPLFQNAEINDVENNDHNSLDVLKHFFENSSPIDNFHCLRRPKCLHVIAHCLPNFNEHNYFSHRVMDVALHYNLRLYITYDENIDIWRLLEEKHCTPLFLLICGREIYMLDELRGIFVADLIARYMYEIKIPFPNFIIKSMVAHRNNVICIGSGGENVISLKFYDTGNGKWSNGPNFENFMGRYVKAVLYQNQVYIVGPAKSGLSIEAQIYNAESNSCSDFASPMIYRKWFEFTEYHGKLFIIGGRAEYSDPLLNKVEVFDPETSTWNLKADLPFSYFHPQATIVNGQLIVSDKFSEENWPVVWNETEEKWQPVEKPLGTKDIRQYMFVTIDKSETIDALVRYNRNPLTVFKRSHFT